MNRIDGVCFRTHSRAHLISHTEVKSTLLIHGVIYPWQLCEFGPFQLEGIIQKTVVRAERESETQHKFLCGPWEHSVIHMSFMSYWMYLLSSCLLQRDQWYLWKAAWTSGAMILPILVSSEHRFPWPSCSIPNLSQTTQHKHLKTHHWTTALR